MKKFSSIVVLVGFALSAHAVQTVELQEHPALKPLHWCKDAEGKVKYQNGECEPGATEVSSVATINADGTRTHEKLGTTLETPDRQSAPRNATPSVPTPVETAKPANNGDDVMRQWRKSVLRLLGFAFFFGIIAKFTGRSFFRWFFVGIAMHFLLVALNVFSV